jgi:hypothetical protein
MFGEALPGCSTGGLYGGARWFRRDGIVVGQVPRKPKPSPFLPPRS